MRELFEGIMSGDKFYSRSANSDSCQARQLNVSIMARRWIRERRSDDRMPALGTAKYMDQVDSENYITFMEVAMHECPRGMSCRSSEVWDEGQGFGLHVTSPNVTG